MTGREIQNLMGYFGKKLPNYAGDEMTDAQALLQINWAIRTLSKRLEQYDSLIVMTLIDGTRSYRLKNTAVFSRKVLKPFYVTIGGSPLKAASGDVYGFHTMHEIERAWKGWRTVETGTPTRAVLSARETITFVRPPDAATVAGAGNYLAGTYMAADLTALTETPDIPEELHECVSYLAAERAGGVMAEGDAWNRVIHFNREWQTQIDEQRILNLNTASDWGTTSGYAVPDLMAF